MTDVSEPSSTVKPPVNRRRAIRYGAATLCSVIGVMYLVLFFLVRDAEAGLTENTFGAYLFLAVPYLAGAALLVAFDLRLLWALGAAAQVVVLVLFALFGAGLFGPGEGVFDYAALSGLQMGLWAITVTGVEVILLGLLTYLALTPPAHHNTPRPAATGIGAPSPL